MREYEFEYEIIYRNIIKVEADSHKEAIVKAKQIISESPCDHKTEHPELRIVS
ncbi:MAG: hypothetical protein WCP79_06850 [Bacillota bacterium]